MKIKAFKFKLLRKLIQLKRYRLKTAHKKAMISLACLVLILSYNNCGPGFKSLTQVAQTDSASSTPTSTTMAGPTTTTTSTTVTLPLGMTSTTTTSTTLKSVTTTTMFVVTSTTMAGVTPTTLPMSTNTSVAPIAFPPNGGTSDSHIVVRGTLAAGVTQVSVNGTSAAITGNTWRLDVPLNVGLNTLSVSVVMNGVTKTEVSSSVVERYASDAVAKRGSGAWPGRSLGMAYDYIHHRVIMTDDIVDGAFSVPIADGIRTKISDSEDSPKLGSGVDITFPTSTVTDGNQCYLVDDNLIIRIDLSNGNRYLVSTGVQSHFGNMYLSPDGTTLYMMNVTDPSSGTTSLVKLNIATGVYTTIYSGSSFRNAAGLGISFARNIAYTSFYYDDPIYTLDLTTGTYKLFSSAQSGEPKFSSAEVIVDDADGKGFVANGKQVAVIDLNTGRRALFGNTGTLSTLSISTMIMSEYGPIIYDATTQALLLIDPIEGTRLLIAK